MLLILAVLFGFAASQNLPFFLRTEPSENILQIVNSTTCSNFYNFACDNWLKTSPQPAYEYVWNKHLELNLKISNRLDEILSERTYKNDSVSLFKAKRFYRACLNMQLHEKKYEKSLKLLVELLKGWPVAKPHLTFDKTSFNWLIDLIQVHKLINIQPLLKFYLNIDYKNTSKSAIYLEPGSLVYPKFILSNSELFGKELETYRNWISKTIKTLYGFEAKASDIEEIVAFEVTLSKLSVGKARNHRTTVGKLSKQVPDKWWKIFNHLFGKVLLTDTVIVRNIAYLRQLFILLQKTEPRIIVNYLIWCVVKDLSREATSDLQKLSFEVDNQVLGVVEDIPLKLECQNKAAKYFGWALVPKYKEKFVEPKTFKDVQELFEKVRFEFIELVQKLDWLSQETIRGSVEKVGAIRSFVGHPDWITEELLDEYYFNLTITDDHFLNVLKAKSFMSSKERELFQGTPKIIWPVNIFEANAYYSILQNCIFLPLGVLEEPFYKFNRPKISNYGALGSLIGHELTHALDSIGRQADKNGVVAQWWPKTDIKSYQSRIQCFEKSNPNIYSIGETIADQTGLQISLNAFQNQDNELDLTQTQFFVSFAQMWCEKNGQEIDVFEDEHSSSRRRVEDALFSNQDFKDSFNCNGTSSCRLW